MQLNSSIESIKTIKRLKKRDDSISSSLSLKRLLFNFKLNSRYVQQREYIENFSIIKLNQLN